MKFCPNCGTKLSGPGTMQCLDCGENLHIPTQESLPKSRKPMKKQKIKKERPKKEKKTAKNCPKEPIPEVMGEAVDDGYDGYYNDVLPPDLDRLSEGMDTELVKKVAFLISGVILVIGACVAMMYVL